MSGQGKETSSVHAGASALHVIVLAGGNSRRFASKTSKVLHLLAGQPLLAYNLQLGASLHPAHLSVVASPALQKEETLQSLCCTYSNCTVAVQPVPKGTANAVMCALHHVPGATNMATLILLGDSPLLRQQSLENIYQHINAAHADVVIVAMRPPSSDGYGRCITDKADNLVRIVEDKVATPSQKAIGLCNSGVMWCGPRATALIETLQPTPETGEIYMTTLIEKAVQQGLVCRVIEAPYEELVGINTRADLAQAEHIMQQRLRAQVLGKGCTLKDPASTFLCVDTHLGPDVVIEPHVVCGPGVVCKAGAVIKSFSYLEHTVVEENAVVGPFARLRGGTIVGEGAEVGNFVEVARSQLASHVKIKHLSYLGDTQIGCDANIGAGVVTCNYDGQKKSKTVIGARAFVGSLNALIAPVHIEEDAMTGAGSAITHNVPTGQLAIARSRQVIKKQSKEA